MDVLDLKSHWLEKVVGLAVGGTMGLKAGTQFMEMLPPLSEPLPMVAAGVCSVALGLAAGMMTAAPMSYGCTVMRHKIQDSYNKIKDAPQSAP